MGSWATDAAKNAKEVARVISAETKELSECVSNDKVELGVLADKKESFVRQTIVSEAMSFAKLLIKDHNTQTPKQTPPQHSQPKPPCHAFLSFWFGSKFWLVSKFLASFFWGSFLSFWLVSKCWHNTKFVA